MAWKSESERHRLASRGILTIEKIKSSPSGWTHRKNCLCVVCSVHRRMAKENFEEGYETALSWANVKTFYSDKEIKKLTLHKLMDAFLRYTSGDKDLPSPDVSPDFYKGAKEYLSGWLKYQKSHI